MLMNIVDGNGNIQTIVVNTQGATTDNSGTLSTSDTSQLVVDANADRSGILFQNKSSHSMYINDVDTGVAASAFLVAAGGTWPSPGYPVPTTAIYVSGTSGDSYVCRTW